MTESDFLTTSCQECPIFSDFDKVCRICLSRSRLSSIFQFKKKIRQCSKIKPRLRDGLPDKICRACSRALDVASHFRLISEASDARLRAALQNKRRQEKNADCHSDEFEFETDAVKNEDVSEDVPLSVLKLKLETKENRGDLTGRDIKAEADLTGRDIKAEGDLAGRDIKAETDLTGRDIKAEGDLTGRDIKAGGDLTGRDIKADGDLTGRDVKTSSDLTFFNCLLCDMSYLDLPSLQTHIASHGKPHDGLYKCYGCGESFGDKKSRFDHEKNHCPKMASGLYKCRECPSEVRSRRALLAHRLAHSRAGPGPAFTCPICRKTLGKRGALYIHIRLNHNQAQGISCPLCDKTVKSEYSMYSHMRTHGERVHACELCPYRTNLPQSLVTHRRKHSGERPYACEHCAYRAVNIGNLNKHIVKHTGVRKHQCKECGKRYKAKKTLLSHVSSFHRGLRPFCCDKCGNKYSRYKTMRAHQKKVHPDG